MWRLPTCPSLILAWRRWRRRAGRTGTPLRLAWRFRPSAGRRRAKASRDQFDPLKTQCPDKDDYFLVPPRPRWYVTSDGGALHRNPTRNFDFASLGVLPMLPSGVASGPTDIVLSTRNYNYDFSAAGRVLIGHTFNDCLQIEGVYLGVAESDNLVAVRDATPNALGGNGNLFSPFGGFGVTPLVGLDYNKLAQIRYTSSLQGGELNIRRQLPMPPEGLVTSILFGVRYIGLPENFDYFTQSDVPTPGGTTNSIHVTTSNEMVGPQIGALFEFYVDNRWWVNVEMKAALMNNRGQQSTTYVNVDNNGVTTQNFDSRREDHTAFAGDLALTFVYRWSPHFTTRLGYQALWLQNLVLAPDNLNTDIDIVRLGPAQLNYTGGTVYHGPFAGITVGW